jgi:RNA polymerase sigma-70 factor, ECF subfamily
MMNWDAVLAEEGPAVWRTLRRLLANHADAEECFQETFLAALRLSEREEVKNWPATLCSIATARAIDRLRIRYRRNKQLLELRDASTKTPSPSNVVGPPEQAVANELAERLRRALAELPEKQAEAFSLHSFSGWSHREVAERLDMTENAVAVTISRARQRLRELLEEKSQPHK